MSPPPQFTDPVEQEAYVQAAVRGDDRVARVADGQGGAVHVSRALFEDAGACPMPYGQVYADAGDADSRHRASRAQLVQVVLVRPPCGRVRAGERVGGFAGRRGRVG